MALVSALRCSISAPAAVVLVGFGLIGCANSGDGFRSGHGANVVVSDLSDEEALELCKEMWLYYDSLHGPDSTRRAACRIDALEASTDGEECLAANERCVEHNSHILTDAERHVRCEDDIAAARSGCRATIAEIESCISDMVEMVGGLLALSCEDAAEYGVGSGLGSVSETCRSAFLSGSCSSFLLPSDR